MTPDQLRDLAAHFANNALGETDHPSEAMTVLLCAAAAVHINCSTEPTLDAFARILAKAIPDAFNAMRTKQ